VWEYAVLPVLVAARLLVSLLGDFDLFVGARQCTTIFPGGVTARSHYCWYDMSYGSRTRAHRRGYMSSSGLAALHSRVHYSRSCTLSIAFHVKETGNEEPGRPHAAGCHRASGDLRDLEPL